MRNLGDIIIQQFRTKYSYCFRSFNDNKRLSYEMRKYEMGKLYLSFWNTQDIANFIDDLAKFIRHDSTINTLYRVKGDIEVVLSDNQVKKIVDALEYNTSIKTYGGYSQPRGSIEESWTAKLKEEVAKERINKKNEPFLNDTDLEGRTLLDYYLLEANTELAVRKLLVQGNYTKDDNSTILSYVLNEDYVKIVEDLIKENPSMVNTVDVRGNTLLHRYVSNDDKAAVQKLVGQGANIGATNIYGWNPLLIAAKKGYLEVAKTLIDTDHSIINTSDSAGYTALHSLVNNNVSQKNTDLIKYLISLGANVNIQTEDDFKITPLHIAAKNGDCEIARILLDAGANRNIKNAGGRTPLDTAKRAGKVDVSDILEKTSYKIANEANDTAKHDTEEVDIKALENVELQAQIDKQNVQLEAQNDRIQQLEQIIKSLSCKVNVLQDAPSSYTNPNNLAGDNTTFENSSDLT